MWECLYRNKKNEEFIKETVTLMAGEAFNSFSSFQSMQKLDVKDGDVIVLRHPGADVGNFS
jgi:hypothetical protein